MKITYGITGVLVIVLSSLGLFSLKIMTENKEKELRSLSHQVQDDQRAIRVLKAEWAYLNRPDNIQSLAVKYLGLKPVAPKHIYASVEVLPWRVSNVKISAPLVDFILTPSEPQNLPVHEANLLHEANLRQAEVVLFEPAVQPIDAISLLMISDIRAGGGQP
jgi:hypothetical protein